MGAQTSSSVDARLDAKVEAARARAYADADARPFVIGAPDGRPRRRRVVLGDPQAPLARALSILARHGLLGPDGRLSPDVQLVSIGDHFDWGSPAEREQARRDGLALLAWLAAHPSDQALIVLGNHDLGRVGELAAFDDARFAAAQAEADAIYQDGQTDQAREPELIARHGVVSAEQIARDLSTFSCEQRALVSTLLGADRFVAAIAAHADTLVTHAGLTTADLDLLGFTRAEHADAPAVAIALNEALQTAAAGLTEGVPLSIGALHRPGSPELGEARGIFCHRASNPKGRDAGDPSLFEGPPRRRFDPRTLPLGLTQVIGHVRDKKCRDLLQGWHDGAEPEDGPLRHLHADRRAVRYQRGLPSRSAADASLATLIFTDAGMLHADEAAYTLYDLDTRAPAPRTR